VGITFRRREQLKSDVVWGVLGKIVQSNSMFGLSDHLEMNLDHVRMRAGNYRTAEKTKGRSLDVMSAIKNNIEVVKAAFLCLAHALINPVSKINRDRKYALYRDDKCLKKPVEELSRASGVDLTNGGVLKT